MAEKAKNNYRNNLRSANELNQRLLAENQSLRQELVRACSILAATLEQFHGGQIDLNLATAVKWLRQREMPIAYREFQEFGILRVETHKASIGSQPGIALPEPSPAEPEPERVICSDLWHSDPEAMGVMCPQCGGKGKVNAPAV